VRCPSYAVAARHSAIRGRILSPLEPFHSLFQVKLVFANDHAHAMRLAVSFRSRRRIVVVGALVEVLHLA
jgi:hypothetical protein